MLDQHDWRGAPREANTIAALNALKEAVDRQAEAQQVFVYVLSLPPAKREKLNLAKPRMLYEMESYGRELRR